MYSVLLAFLREGMGQDPFAVQTLRPASCWVSDHSQGPRQRVTPANPLASASVVSPCSCSLSQVASLLWASIHSVKQGK